MRHWLKPIYTCAQFELHMRKVWAQDLIPAPLNRIARSKTPGFYTEYHHAQIAAHKLGLVPIHGGGAGPRSVVYQAPDQSRVKIGSDGTWFKQVERRT